MQIRWLATHLILHVSSSVVLQFYSTPMQLWSWLSLAVPRSKCDPSPFHRYLVHVKFSPSWSPSLYVALTCLVASSTSVNEMLGTSHLQKLCPYLSLATAYSLTLHKEYHRGHFCLFLTMQFFIFLCPWSLRPLFGKQRGNGGVRMPFILLEHSVVWNCELFGVSILTQLK